MTDEVEEIEEIEEYDPREVMIPEEAVAVPDLDALESAVIEITGLQPVAWQFKDGGLFVLLHGNGALKWQSVEDLRKPRGLKAVN